MARPGKQIPPPLHGRFASPPPSPSSRLIHQPILFPLESVPDLSLSPCHSLHQKRHSCVSTSCIPSRKGAAPNRSLIWKKGVQHAEVERKHMRQDADHLQLFFGCVKAGQRGRDRRSFEEEFPSDVCISERIVRPSNGCGYRLGRRHRTYEGRDEGIPGLPARCKKPGRVEQDRCLHTAVLPEIARIGPRENGKK